MGVDHDASGHLGQRQPEGFTLWHTAEGTGDSRSSMQADGRRRHIFTKVKRGVGGVWAGGSVPVGEEVCVSVILGKRGAGRRRHHLHFPHLLLGTYRTGTPTS